MLNSRKALGYRYACVIINIAVCRCKSGHVVFEIVRSRKLYIIGRHDKLGLAAVHTIEKIYDAVINSKYYDGKLPIEKIYDFKETVLAAANAAQYGDIVLLSPACAAFDKFKNFMERGKYFKQIVMEL